MFIDTIMALWNRIWYGRLKRVFVTSFLFGISIVLLAIMIGVPILSHSSSIARHTMQSVDTANNKEGALPAQPHLDGLSTPPPSPTMLPTSPLFPTVSIVVSKQQIPSEVITVVPATTVVIIAGKQTSVKIIARAAVKHRRDQVAIKDIKPTSTSTSIVAPTPTSMSNIPVVSTPTPELPPTPIITIITIPVGDKTPTPEATGTVQPDPTLTATPTNTYQ